MAFKCDGTKKECQDALLGILSIIEACKPGDHDAAWRALGAIRETAHRGLLGREEWVRWIEADVSPILGIEAKNGGVVATWKKAICPQAVNPQNSL